MSTAQSATPTPTRPCTLQDIVGAHGVDSGDFHIVVCNNCGYRSSHHTHDLAHTAALDHVNSPTPQ